MECHLREQGLQLLMGGEVLKYVMKCQLFLRDTSHFCRVELVPNLLNLNLGTMYYGPETTVDVLELDGLQCKGQVSNWLYHDSSRITYAHMVGRYLTTSSHSISCSYTRPWYRMHAGLGSNRRFSLGFVHWESLK